MNKYCHTCKKTKLFRCFRYTSQQTPNAVPRRLFGRMCNACRTAALLKDERKLETAVQRGEVGHVQGTLLLQKMRSEAATRKAEYRAQQVERALEAHRLGRYLTRECNLHKRSTAELRAAYEYDPAEAQAYEAHYAVKLAEGKDKYARLKARVAKGDHNAIILYASLDKGDGTVTPR